MVTQTCVKRNSVENITNFVNEIRVLSSVSHPNIVGFRSSFYDPNLELLCLVMEYTPEGALSVR